MADPVTAGLAIMAVGSATGAVGGMAADKAQAKAESDNAEYYRKQADYSRLSTERELDIFQNEVDDLLGKQLSAFGKAGITVSGSPLLLIGQTKDRADEEFAAIKEKGRQTVELSLFKALGSDAAADGIRKAAPLKFAGTILSGMGSMFAAKKGA